MNGATLRIAIEGTNVHTVILVWNCSIIQTYVTNTVYIPYAGQIERMHVHYFDNVHVRYTYQIMLFIQSFELIDQKSNLHF